ncbi:MAG: sodium:proton antiporter [Clostridiaceae bacterium]|nr:sodium:proton antiporter [Clostridiaceae bacterium]
MLLMNPSVALAAEEGGAESIGATLPILFCIPFAGMLLCIAICPLVAEAWWERRKPFVVLFWSLAFLIPFAVYAGTGVALEEACEAIFGDYITFIILLFGLFCVTGNICFEGDLTATPKLNALLLLIGALLASWIGTTGASMVMVRPLIRANRWRHRKVHIMVFFIFLVSNIGGCLTPVGDPPLLMGFMRGVDFFWSLSLLPLMILNVVLLLGLFLILDTRAYKKDLADGDKPVRLGAAAKLRLTGAHNIFFLAMIIAAIILSSTLPDFVPFFGKELTIYGDVSLSVAAIFECVLILLAAFLSFRTTKKEVRTSNNFTWGPIAEVATLFIGIFITMTPALLILEAKGDALGITEPWQFFWITGALSSFLDNTPTYMVFFTTASSLGFTEGVKTIMGYIPQIMLMAVSAGAVFMGAITYIGNAPNFMVRSIAEENGIKMPSFFKYLIWSISCLVPVFLIDTLIFFL